MKQLTLEEMVDFSRLSDKIFIPVENPTFYYKNTVLKCYTRAIDITSTKSLNDVYQTGIILASDYIDTLECEIVFVLSHDVAQIGENKYRYKLRFATDGE